ncbi:hypothetical protein E2P81_ATG01882 [Venturia nashicola]|uniref:Uncharacterized protein n=1 Tax=Venturia nashicola TaxID=86259 RepID=A0A4Z1PCL6_9PEZI|nr:hypothetical protein E6O75_ATG01925 [Venturia nashicola]TLD35579.1 hypothetical protein E2P81_ATG01882 [Venturia nashicola]
MLDALAVQRYRLAGPTTRIFLEAVGVVCFISTIRLAQCLQLGLRHCTRLEAMNSWFTNDDSANGKSLNRLAIVKFLPDGSPKAPRTVKPRNTACCEQQISEHNAQIIFNANGQFRTRGAEAAEDGA